MFMNLALHVPSNSINLGVPLPVASTDLSSKSFFPGLVKYMSSGPVVAMVWEGKEVRDDC